MSLGIFFSVGPPEGTMCPEVDSASESKYQGKGGRCVWLTTYHPSSAELQENPLPYLPGTPWATSGCCVMTFTFTFTVFLD